MRNLYDFIVKNIHVFLFILLTIVGLFFIYNSSSYRQWAINSMTKEMIGPFLKLRSTYIEYIHLKEINAKLLNENRKLLHKAYNQDFSVSTEFTYKDTSRKPIFDYITASVIENTIHLQNNYIILDRGRKDSVFPDMGVISNLGIVGIVKDVSPNYCIVLSVLYKEFSLSAKLLKNNVAGILLWDGMNHAIAQLKNITTVENIVEGDTVVVQHSLIFPTNYPIGTVANINQQVKGGYYVLDIQLFEKMDRINKVWIIKNNYADELTKLKKMGEDE
mgnify:CR=1 FL=1